MIDLIKFLIEIGILGGVVYVGYSIFAMRSISIKNAQKTEQKKAAEPKKEVHDFYGVHQLNHDEKKFFENISDMQGKLDRGEQIGVNAAQALFMMRNHRHSDMVISEHGMLTIQKTIMEFGDHESAQKEAGSEAVFDDQSIVERIEDLPDGGYRNWFTKEHALSCGVTSIRFDAQGRPCGDPEMDEGSSKNKKHKGGGGASDGPTVTEALLADISKKMSKQSEMIADVLVDRKLQDDSHQNKQPDSRSKNPKKEASGKDSIGNIPLQENPVLAQDFADVALFASQPDYLSVMSEAMKASEPVKTDPLEADESGPEEAEKEMPLGDDNEVGLIDGGVDYLFNFVDYEHFVTILAVERSFIQLVIEKIFTGKWSGKIYALYREQVFLIEKNYLMESVKRVLVDEDMARFEKEFLNAGKSNLYDGKKVSELVRSMNGNNAFVFEGKKGAKVLFEMALDLEETSIGILLSGVFVKLKMESVPDTNEFLAKNGRLINASVVADNKGKIDALPQNGVKKIW